MALIEDGKGRGYVGAVNSRNRQMVEGPRSSSFEDGADEGDAYIISSNVHFITNTSSQHTLLYLRNTDTDEDLKIDNIRMSSDQAGTRFRLFVQAATVSATVTAQVVNTNRNSGKSLAAATFVYTTATPAFTGGTLAGQIIGPAGASNMEVDSAIILGETNNVLLSVQAPVSAHVAATMNVHRVERR